MYLLDTNICIYAMKNKYPELTRKLFQVFPSEIFISIITVSELEYGCAKSKWGDRSRAVMQTFLSAYTILPFEGHDAVVLGRIRAALDKKGRPTNPYDALIAAHAVARGLTLVTHNIPDFANVPGIVIEDWVGEE